MSPRPNLFAGSLWERSAHRRSDTDWLERILRSEGSRFVPLWRSLNLISTDQSRAVLLPDPPDEADQSATIFLGESHGLAYFATEIADDLEPRPSPDAKFQHLRRIGALMSAEEASLLAYARAMVLWHRRHRYCGRCGSPNTTEQAGHVLRCTSTECARTQFPRIDPAIIVLVTDGERCLLGRHAEWPEDVYSTIAGFVEPGESLEDAVAREVLEETGIQVSDVHYHSSQPWPFPSSLMLGFTAKAETTEIQRNDSELEDAQWFRRVGIASGSPVLPSRLSISYRLIEDWYDLDCDLPLQRLDTVRTRW